MIRAIRNCPTNLFPGFEIQASHLGGGIRMQGDQLSRQWRAIRASEASLNELTVADIAKREETGIRTICHYLEAPQAAGFARYTGRANRVNHWAFIDTFKFKIPLIVSRKAAKFAKKAVLHLPVLNIYLVQFLGRISQLGKGPLRSLRLGVRYDFRLAPFDLWLFLC